MDSKKETDKPTDSANEKGFNSTLLIGGLFLLFIAFVFVMVTSSESFDEEYDDVPVVPETKPLPPPPASVPPPSDMSIVSKLQSQFADEDNPIAGYTSYLQKTGRFNPHRGGNFFMENEQNNLYKKQGVISAEEEYKQKAYTEGQYGRWGLSAIQADDSRQTTSPYVGTTRSLRAVKIRANDTIRPDKISDTFHPIM